MLLVDYMVQQDQRLFNGKCVVELGCGTGLAGLVAYRLGAEQTWLTDFEVRRGVGPAREVPRMLRL